MSANKGQQMATAVGEIFGIDPSFIFEMEADAHEITITRGVHDSQGRIAIMVDSHGEIDACRVRETFSFR